MDDEPALFHLLASGEAKLLHACLLDRDRRDTALRQLAERLAPMEWEELLLRSLICAYTRFEILVKPDWRAAFLLSQRLGRFARCSLDSIVRNRALIGQARWNELIFQLQVKTLVAALFIMATTDPDEMDPAIPSLGSLLENVRGPKGSWCIGDVQLVASWEEGLTALRAAREDGEGLDESEFICLSQEILIDDILTLVYVIALDNWQGSKLSIVFL